MKRIAAALLLVGAVLLTTWVVSPAPASPASAPVLATARSGATQQPASSPLPDVAAQVERLRARLSTPPQPPVPERNPFAFGRRPEPPRPKGAAPVTPVPVVREAAPAPTLPRLLAIMSTTSDAASGRTASLAVGDDVQVVKPGDLVGTLLVKAVTADVVELFDPSSGATYRLSLR